MDAVALIPARYGSTRLPGKPLLDVGGKPLIQRVWEIVSQARRISRVFVATDDRRIAEAVRAFGGEALMTSSAHPTGTDRIAEVAPSLEADLIVNVQGDELLSDPEMIDQAIEPLIADASVPMATLAHRISTVEELQNPGVVKVVVNGRGFALYFSRHPIPFLRDEETDQAAVERHRFLRHIGLYAYRRDFLLTFARLVPTPLERMEKLEQLRALEHGYRIAVVETPHRSSGVDTAEDLERARQRCQRMGSG